MDILICGTCKAQYSALEDFIRHKQHNCAPAPTPAPTCTVGGFAIDSQSVIRDSQIPVQQVASATVSVTPLNPAQLQNQGSSVNAKADGKITNKSTKTCAPVSSRTSLKQKPSEKPKPRQYTKQFRCPFASCTFVTVHQKDLQRHERTHTGEQPFACQYCSKRFSRNDKKKIHERQHTGEKPYKCQICQYKCADGGSLKKHVRIHRNERPFQCQLCSYASRNSSQLVVHLRRHTGDCPFHCQKCDAKFKTNTDLKRHLPIHTGEKRFSCDQCDYRSHLKCNVKSHIASNHAGELNRHCNDCDFACRTKKQLHSHVALNHTAQNSSYKCMECVFTTSSKEAFHRHSKKHSTEPISKCKFCSYTARNRSTVSAHMRKKHQDGLVTTEASQSSVTVTCRPPPKERKKGKHARRPSKKSVSVVDGKRPFNCSQCSASFVREDSLRSHCRQHKRVLETPENTSFPIQQTQDLQQFPQKQTGDKDVANISNVASDVVVTTSSLGDTDRSFTTDDSRHEDLDLLLPLTSCIMGSSDNDNAATVLAELSTAMKSGNGNESMLSQCSVNEPTSSDTQIISSTGSDKGNCINILEAGLRTEPFEMCETSTDSFPSVSMNVSNPNCDSLMSILTDVGKTQNPSSNVEFTQLQLHPGQTTVTDISKVLSNAETLSKISGSGSQVQPTSVGEQVPVTNAQISSHQIQPSVVQTQTLGYGTSNIPILMAPRPPSLGSVTVLPSIDTPGRTVIINNPADQKQAGNPVSTSRSPVINVVTVANFNIGGAGSVQLIYANASQETQPSVIPTILQQIPATRQQQQQLPLTVRHLPNSSTRSPAPSAAGQCCLLSGNLSATGSVSGPAIVTAVRPVRQQMLQSSGGGIQQPQGGRSFILNGRTVTSNSATLELQPSVTISCTPFQGSQ